MRELTEQEMDTVAGGFSFHLKVDKLVGFTIKAGSGGPNIDATFFDDQNLVSILVGAAVVGGAVAA